MQVILDNSRMNVGPEGIESFFWPVRRSEMNTFRDALFSGLALVARSRNDALDLERDLFGAICHFLTKEGMALYMVHTLIRRIRAAGHDPVWPCQSILFPAISQNEAPSVPDSLLVKTLMKGPACHPRWKRPAVKLYYDFRFNGSSLAAFRPFRFRKDIVACYPTEVLEVHAQSIPDVVKYSDLGEWFTPLGDKNIKKLPAPLARQVREEAVHAVRTAFEIGGETLPDYLAEYLDGMLSEGSKLARLHMDRILNNPGKIPSSLWSGSGGYIWVRLLSHAVRRVGGKVVGHEHGTGEGMIAYFNSKTFMDLECTDKFVTFNSNQCRWLHEIVDEKFLVPHRRPKIEIPPYLPGLKKYANDATRLKGTPRSPGRIRRVMYVGTIYCNERPRAGQHNADPVMVDWQARLLAKLREWNYEVLYKAHPEGEQRPPAAFFEQMGAKMVAGRFEEVWDQADAFLFDWKSTTTFSAAMNTDRPIILFDFGFEEFVLSALELITKRCNVIEGEFDMENRLQINWEKLRMALEEPQNSDNDAFLETALRFA